MVRCCKTLIVILCILLSGCGGIFNGTIVGDIYNTADDFTNTSAGPNNLSLVIFGGIYSHTISPLTVNPDRTEVKEGIKEGRGRVNQISYPLTAGMSIRLGKNGLGDIAKEHSMSTIYYADMERWSILFGLWSSEVVHIYGR